MTVAAVAQQLGDYDLLLPCLQRAVQLRGCDAQLRYKLAITLVAEGKGEEAVGSFLEALQVSREAASNELTNVQLMAAAATAARRAGDCPSVLTLAASKSSYARFCSLAVGAAETSGPRATASAGRCRTNRLTAIFALYIV